MAFEAFFNTIFGPLLALPILFTILILSLIISVIIILITKFTTDQKLMKELKDQMKEHQKQIKEHRGNPSKALELQKRAMDANMKYMIHSLKPTLITFIPVILIFGWMSATFAYDHILPDQEFKVYATFADDISGTALLSPGEGLTIVGSNESKIEAGTIGKKELDRMSSWTLKGDEGTHDFSVHFNGEKVEHKVLITAEDKYSSAVKNNKGQIESVQIGYRPKKLLNLFGWKLGWLGTYIIFSIAFTMLLRKFMKVY
jgi:uncharacterized membrane protein (DUF106 family)